MTLRLNGSNSGFTEVKAPATAGSNTLILPTSNGSANQVLRNGSTAGTLEFATPFQVAKGTKVNTTSGTTIDFSVESYAKRITIMFDGVSCDTNAQLGIRIGDSGGIEDTGYFSGCFTNASSGGFDNSTVRFILTHSGMNTASNGYYGSVILTNLDGNSWASQGVLHAATTYGAPAANAGTKTLSGTLDRLQIAFTSGNFDAGQINIMYEG